MKPEDIKKIKLSDVINHPDTPKELKKFLSTLTPEIIEAQVGSMTEEEKANLLKTITPEYAAYKTATFTVWSALMLTLVAITIALTYNRPIGFSEILMIVSCCFLVPLYIIYAISYRKRKKEKEKEKEKK